MNSLCFSSCVGHAERDKADVPHAEQDHAEQDHAEQDHAEQDHAEQDHAEQDEADVAHVDHRGRTTRKRQAERGVRRHPALGTRGRITVRIFYTRTVVTWKSYHCLNICCNFINHIIFTILTFNYFRHNTHLQS